MGSGTQLSLVSEKCGARTLWLSMVTAAVVAAIALCFVPGAQGQVRQGQSPKFEVVSIVPQPPGTRWREPPLGTPGPVQPGGRYRDPQATLFSLVRFAYPDTGIPGKTVLGGPLWGRQKLYNFQAVAPRGKPPTRDAMRLMMRAVLASRFGLKFHIEHREMSVFVLTLAKGGAKNLRRANPAAESNSLSSSVGASGLFIVARAISIPELAGYGFAEWGPVVDHTGLAGYYDIDVTPKNVASFTRGAGPEEIEHVMETSFREEFGIDVTSGKASVPVMVIDSVHPPTRN